MHCLPGIVSININYKFNVNLISGYSQFTHVDKIEKSNTVNKLFSNQRYICLRPSEEINCTGMLISAFPVRIQIVLNYWSLPSWRGGNFFWNIILGSLNEDRYCVSAFLAWRQIVLEGWFLARPTFLAWKQILREGNYCNLLYPVCT